MCAPNRNARNSLPISYTKDNASGEATWRAARWASVGGGAYWERYDRHLRDVNVTDEYSGKTWVDLDPDRVRACAGELPLRTAALR